MHLDMSNPKSDVEADRWAGMSMAHVSTSLFDLNVWFTFVTAHDDQLDHGLACFAYIKHLCVSELQLES